VNGQVHVGRGVTANEAKTVNGQVVIEEDVKLGKASTVNGQLRVGEGSIIEHEARR
jgi:acetyltransferase-like isoleucine patch superfamily enzyme